MSKVWMITGASRGFGREIARAALATGDAVVATSRRGSRPDGLPESDDLLPLALDVTDSDSVDAAVAAVLERFGRIDVLVNNAGYGQVGFFEELSPERVEAQFRTNVFGVFDVTRAVLPVMRRQRSGHVITISSIAGLTAGVNATVYGATKAAVSVWSEALEQEVSQFGIHTTVIHPGAFRTDFFDPTSLQQEDVEIDDYANGREQRRSYYTAKNHEQPGDPVRFGQAVVELAAATPPVRWAAGSDAFDVYIDRAATLERSARAGEALTRSADVA
jgi:NAD(P)-dependent dehydrogenase (short-subunit alcohol dehydrogenase family)